MSYKAAILWDLWKHNIMGVFRGDLRVQTPWNQSIPVVKTYKHIKPTTFYENLHLNTPTIFA